MYLKLSSAKWWPFCLGLNVLNDVNKRGPLALRQSHHSNNTTKVMLKISGTVSVFTMSAISVVIESLCENATILNLTEINPQGSS